MLSLLLLLAVGATIWWYISTFNRRKAAIRAPNAPPGPPVSSNYLWPFAFDLTLLKMQLFDGLTPGEAFLKATNETAANFDKEGICRIWLGFMPLVLIYKPETAEVLLSSSQLISKSFQYSLLHCWLGTGLLTSTGDKWRSRRKMLTPAFHFKILEDFSSVFAEQSSILCDQLRKAVHKEVDIVPYLTKCTLDIICETAMGEKLRSQTNPDEKASEYVNALSALADDFMSRMTKPWLSSTIVFKMTSGGRRFFRNLAVLHKFTNKVISNRKQEIMEDQQSESSNDAIEGKRRKALLDLLLEEYLVKGSLTLEDIREEVDTFMFEGHDTTSMALTWTFFVLGLHPDVQAKVHDELDSVFGGDRERTVTTDDIKDMKYLDCVIKEAMRLYATVPFIGRQNPQEIQMNGYTIPRDTVCWFLFSVLHKNEKYFPNAETFDPDRFLPENIVGRHPYAYAPFSAGPRNCIGQKFALNEEKIVLTSVLRQFQLKSVSRPEDLRFIGAFVLRPVNGVKVIFRPRPVDNYNFM